MTRETLRLELWLWERQDPMREWAKSEVRWLRVARSQNQSCTLTGQIIGRLLGQRAGKVAGSLTLLRALGRDCKLTSCALTRSASSEIPSLPVLNRTWFAEFRRLTHSLEQSLPSPGLLSGANITRFCQSRFSMRIRNTSLSFLIPMSPNQDDDIAEKFTSSRVPAARQHSSLACSNNDRSRAQDSPRVASGEVRRRGAAPNSGASREASR